MLVRCVMCNEVLCLLQNCNMDLPFWLFLNKCIFFHCWCFVCTMNTSIVEFVFPCTAGFVLGPQRTEEGSAFICRSAPSFYQVCRRRRQLFSDTELQEKPELHNTCGCFWCGKSTAAITGYRVSCTYVYIRSVGVIRLAFSWSQHVCGCCYLSVGAAWRRTPPPSSHYHCGGLEGLWTEHTCG